MDTAFHDAVAELVRKCNNNQSEAARRAGISVALVSDTLAGKGPREPKRGTMAKVEKALGRSVTYAMSAPAPLMVRETNGELADELLKLAAWIRQHRHAWPFVLNAARGCGYKDTHD